MADPDKPMTAQDVINAMSILRPLRPMFRALGELYPAMEVAAGALNSADSLQARIAELRAEAELSGSALLALNLAIEEAKAQHASLLSRHADQIAASAQQVADEAEASRVAIQKARDATATAEGEHQRRVVALQNNHATRSATLEREHKARMAALEAEQTAATKSLDDTRTQLRTLRDDVVRVAEA